MVYIKTKNTIYVLNFNNRLVKLAFLYSFVFSLLIYFFQLRTLKLEEEHIAKTDLLIYSLLV